MTLLSDGTARPDTAAAPTDTALQRCLDRTVEYLRQQQRDADHWAGTLSSSALAAAISIVALHLADRERYREQVRRGRHWLLRTQNDDGGWGDAVVDPSNINATSLAIGALTFTADEADEGADADAPALAPLARARARLDRFGGFAAVGDPARCTFSGPCRTVACLAGLMSWQRIKQLRPEIILLPARVRRAVSTTFPAYLSIATLQTAKAPRPLNRLPTYGRARRRVVEWLGQAQGPNGSFEESAFLTSVIITCMVASGQDTLPWLPAAIRFVAESQREDGGWPIDRDLETFDTSMTIFAFQAAGLPVPHAERVRDWLLARQFDEVCFPTSARPGGWAWAMPAGWPECDDTSYALLALRALGVRSSATSVRRGVRWLEEMQNADGSWATFVRDSRMPFDHDCPYITGHALCALQSVGRLNENRAPLDRALAYLARAQRYDGSFASIWFREATAGTASVLEALADCGLLRTPMAARACAALLRAQNDDGGWAGLRGQDSTAEETAWAVMALTRCLPAPAAGARPLNDPGSAGVSPAFGAGKMPALPEDDWLGSQTWVTAGAAAAAIGEAIRRGAAWLIAHQRADGTWIPAPIGLYFSSMWYSDSYYAVTLPLQALARASYQLSASVGYSGERGYGDAAPEEPPISPSAPRRRIRESGGAGAQPPKNLPFPSSPHGDGGSGGRGDRFRLAEG